MVYNICKVECDPRDFRDSFLELHCLRGEGKVNLMESSLDYSVLFKALGRFFLIW